MGGWVVIPAGAGMACIPLDSSFRWNDGEGWVPVCAGMMVEGLCRAFIESQEKADRMMTQPFLSPVVIPAKAGIQENRAGMLAVYRQRLLAPDREVWGVGLSFPLTREWLAYTTGFQLSLE